MSLINNQIEKLTPQEKKAIIYAFENQQPYYVKLEDNRFVGVHITSEPNLIIEEVVGAWSLGRLK